jgi:SpoVK/Ycf46/Vps4 family AAA+-type ATPase
MQSLQKYLKNFKNFRDRYDKFGMPYRGGILLSGVPGCGKSSTILATATFLMKDIYYLDLGQIKNNEELKLCVEFLRTNSKSGGIVIFEDIDCMTPIVLKRNNFSVNETVPGISNGNTDNSLSSNIVNTNLQSKKASSIFTDDDSQPLSLSFLLNVLDGTMAPEDVIFMMTTNYEKLLDPALIRPGRIDLKINVTHCTRYQLRRIYKDLYDKTMPEEIIERFPENKWITAKVILHLFHNSFNRTMSVEKLMESFLTGPKPVAHSALSSLSSSTTVPGPVSALTVGTEAAEITEITGVTEVSEVTKPFLPLMS